MSNRLLVGLVVVAVLVGGGYLIAGSQKPAPAASTQTTTPAPTPAPTTPTVKTVTVEMTIKDKKITSGNSTIKVNQGDTVVLRVTSNEAEELHIHGYDKSVELVKDTPVELSFEADKSGGFPFELEHSKTDIGVLEVAPR